MLKNVITLFHTEVQYLQNVPVTTENKDQVRAFCHLRNGAASLRLRDFGGPVFDDHWVRTRVKFANDIARQVCHARLFRVRDQADGFRAHIKNSWLPSVPAMDDCEIPTTTFPPPSINDAILRFAFSCSEGSRTIPPRPTSARSNSNCGL